LELTEDFRSIVLQNTPLLDVRAPVEFEKGAFAQTTNLPILTDKERELVGTMYKEQGNAAAVELAEELIQESGKNERVQEWKNYLQKNPNALLYCFRGGQRSGIAQAWLGEVGINITRLKGGYKAFRNFLMQESLDISKELKTTIIGGRTGSGKTILLQELENAIDLEGLAHHRGSTFGGFVNAQPTQINFENDLAYALIQLQAKGFKELVIEHESHNVGRIFIPKEIYENFMNGELILLETPLEQRVAIIFEEYIENALSSYIKKYGDTGIQKWSDNIAKNLDRIQKRVGSKRHKELKILFENALKKQLEDDTLQGYKPLIEKLLIEYYDPMYDYQIQKSKIPIIFKGNYAEILEFLHKRNAAK